MTEVFLQKVDALRHLGEVVPRVGFEFDHDRPREILAAKFGEDVCNARNAGAINSIGRARADGGALLEVHGADAAGQELDGVKRNNAGCGVMTRVGAHANARVQAVE